MVLRAKIALWFVFVVSDHRVLQRREEDVLDIPLQTRIRGQIPEGVIHRRAATAASRARLVATGEGRHAALTPVCSETCFDETGRMTMTLLVLCCARASIPQCKYDWILVVTGLAYKELRLSIEGTA